VPELPPFTLNYVFRNVIFNSFTLVEITLENNMKSSIKASFTIMYYGSLPWLKFCFVCDIWPHIKEKRKFFIFQFHLCFTS